MITVKIVSDFLSEGLAIAGYNVSESTMNIEGQKPMEVMNAMIELKMDWKIDFSQATDEELIAWTEADLVGRIVRAEKMGKTVIMEGEPLNHDEVIERVTDFAAKHEWFPDVLEDNSLSLILGRVEADEESVEKESEENSDNDDGKW